MSKTRVEVINEAIHYLHIEEHKTVRDIQHELLKRNIDLSLLEILNILASFNLRVVKEVKLREVTIERAKFKEAVAPLIFLIRRLGITNKTLFAYFQLRGIPAPNTDHLTKDKLDSLLLSLNFKFPKLMKVKYVNMEMEEFSALVENELSVEEHEVLDNWIGK